MDSSTRSRWVIGSAATGPSCLPTPPMPMHGCATWWRVRRTTRKQLSPSLPYRVGLLDRDDRFLAGTIASRAMIVFASIDTLERPVVVDGVVVGHVVVARSQDPGDDLAIAFLLEQQRNLLFFGCGRACPVELSLAALVLARHFRQADPVARLTGARQPRSRALSTRASSIRRSDELGELAETFNYPRGATRGH